MIGDPVLAVDPGKVDGLEVRAVPLFCRLAMASACADVVRPRRIGRGDPRADTYEVLSAARTLMAKLALAPTR